MTAAGVRFGKRLVVFACVSLLAAVGLSSGAFVYLRRPCVIKVTVSADGAYRCELVSYRNRTVLYIKDRDGLILENGVFRDAQFDADLDWKGDRCTLWTYQSSSGTEEAVCVGDRVVRLPVSTDQQLAQLAGSDCVEQLELRADSISDAGLACLPRLQQLTELTVASVGVTARGLAHLKDCVALESVELAGGQFDDAALDKLQPGPKLTHLILRNTSITPDAVNSFSRRWPVVKVSSIPAAMQF